MLQNPNVTQKSKSGSIYKSHEKGFLITKISHEEAVWVITGHCFPFHSFNRDVMDFKYIYNELEEKLLYFFEKSTPAIIGADFNTTRLQQLMPNLFRLSYSLFDIPTRPNGRSDDYILCSRQFVERKYKVVETCFDHYACVSTLKW
jgi:hypothetical protein